MHTPYTTKMYNYAHNTSPVCPLSTSGPSLTVWLLTNESIGALLTGCIVRCSVLVTLDTPVSSSALNSNILRKIKISSTHLYNYMQCTYSTDT